ncbi:maleylacetoacetate isomerase [Xanthobacter autotrophicus DSM 431]|uniref:maleylacetoacetate isomerase n=1 Tax=Xanthobacter nonsaccharivorans TaxID=3119912 RepID=UPI00372A3EDE
MELFGFFRSSASYRVRIALAFKGLAFEPHYVSLPKMEHKADAFLRLNPEGLVPALVDAGRVFTQSLAIMEYLEETRPDPPFLPEAPEARAYVRAVSQIICCDIHPLNNVRVLKYLDTRLGQSEADRSAWYAHWIAEGFRSIEGVLAARGVSGRFVLGDAPGMADICLVPQVFNAHRFNCHLAEYPMAMRIYENCMAIECFESAHPKYQADAF